MDETSYTFPKTIIIQCEGCGELLYNTKLTLKNIGGKVARSSDFISIGNQPDIVDGEVGPKCWKCDTQWIGFTKDGLEMSTTNGRMGDTEFLIDE